MSARPRPLRHFPPPGSGPGHLPSFAWRRSLAGQAHTQGWREKPSALQRVSRSVSVSYVLPQFSKFPGGFQPSGNSFDTDPFIGQLPFPLILLLSCSVSWGCFQNKPVNMNPSQGLLLRERKWDVRQLAFDLGWWKERSDLTRWTGIIHGPVWSARWIKATQAGVQYPNFCPLPHTLTDLGACRIPERNLRFFHLQPSPYRDWLILGRKKN